MDELRKGIAVLAQEHQKFPVVEENIKLGSAEADAMDDREKVVELIVAAGAKGIVKNFSSGYGQEEIRGIWGSRGQGTGSHAK